MMLDLLARAKDGEGVKSGPIGLAVILVLCIAAYFLFKSMSKHLKYVREEFPADPSDPTARTAARQPAGPATARTTTAPPETAQADGAPTSPGTDPDTP